MLLIVNPVSGTRDKRALIERIVGELYAKGITVDVAPTQHAGHATILAADGVARGYDGVLACGGDGTVNEVATAMCGARVPMGIIPAGSGNGLARHIEIPIDPIASLDVIAAGHVDDCDYGTVNSRPFFCTFGLGFDAAVSDRFAASGHRGLLTYLRSTIVEFMNYKAQRYTITVDGRTFERNAFVVTGANASQYGNNAYIAPSASIRDGLLDLIIVHDASAFNKTLVGLDMMTGTLGSNRNFEIIRCTQAHIYRHEPGPSHIDGEVSDLPQQIDMECHPAQLKIFTPANKPQFRPIITPARSILRTLFPFH